MYSSVCTNQIGTPDVTVFKNGMLQMYPTSSPSLCLIMTTDEWDELAAAVDVARKAAK